MTHAMLIADYVISKGDGRFTPLEIIKLVYISHGFTLALEKKPLIENRIEAWKYGPVIPVIYHALKHNSGSKVSRLQYCGTHIHDESIYDRVEFLERAIGKRHKAIIDQILKKYDHMNGNDLSNLTHASGTPWSECYKKNKLHIPIPNNIIQKHYEDLLIAVSN